MHHSPNPQTRFSSRAPPSSGRTKRFTRISIIHPASTTRPKPASAENQRASQKAGTISELGVLHPRQIGNLGETVCSNKLVDQRSCRRGCTAMLVQDSASISDKLLPQSRIAQQNWRFRVAAQSPNCSAANSVLSGQGCAPKGRSQKNRSEEHTSE